MNGGNGTELVIAAPGDQGGALHAYNGAGELVAYIGGLGGSGDGIMVLSDPVDVNNDGYTDVVSSAGPNAPVVIVLGGTFDSPSLLAVPQPSAGDGFGAAIGP